CSDRQAALAAPRHPPRCRRRSVPVARSARRDADGPARGEGATATGCSRVRPRRTALSVAAVDSTAGLKVDVRAITRHGIERASRSRIVARRVVYGGSAVYALLFVVIAAAHVESFHAGRADLGSMVQAIWSTLHGHFLGSTSFAGRENTRLVAHVDPFLALLAPLWLIWSSPLMLLVFQALAVTSGALPVYWLAR